MEIKLHVTLEFDIKSDTTAYGKKEVTPEEAAQIELKNHLPEDLVLLSSGSITTKIKVVNKKQSSLFKYTILVDGEEQKFELEAGNDETALRKAARMMEKFAKEDSWSYLVYKVIDEYACPIGEAIIENDIPEEEI